MVRTQRGIWNSEYQAKENLWSKETLELPKVCKNKRVLELGVGNGKTLKAILRQKPESVVAIDFSEEAIEQCKTLFSSYKHLTLLEADMTKMPFNGEDFDIVVCYYALNNLLKQERQKAVKEIGRVLKPKGKVVFEDFAVGDFRESRRERRTMESHTIKKKNGLICHFFTKSETNLLFKQFKKVKIREVLSKPITHKNLERRIVSAVAFN